MYNFVHLFCFSVPLSHGVVTTSFDSQDPSFLSFAKDEEVTVLGKSIGSNIWLAQVRIKKRKCDGFYLFQIPYAFHGSTSLALYGVERGGQPVDVDWNTTKYGKQCLELAVHYNFTCKHFSHKYVIGLFYSMPFINKKSKAVCI